MTESSRLPTDQHVQGWLSQTTMVSPSNQRRTDPFADGSVDKGSQAHAETSRLLEPEEITNESPYQAMIHCCKCEETQELFSDWNSMSDNSATCRKCTAAFCERCSIAHGNISKSDRKGRILLAAEDASYHWICTNCGVLYDIPKIHTRRNQNLVSIETKTCACEPCNQRATSDTLFFAHISDESKREPMFDQDTGSLATYQPRNSGWISARSSWASWNSGSSRLSRSWSIKSSLKRWTSSSSKRESIPLHLQS